MTRTTFLATLALGTCAALTAPAADLAPTKPDVLKGHKEPVQGVAFMSDSEHLVSVAYKEIFLWDISNPEKFANPDKVAFTTFQQNEYTWGTPRVRFDGLYVAIPGTFYAGGNTLTNPSSIRLYQIEFGKDAIRILPAGEVGATQAEDTEHDTMTEVAFSPANTRIAGVRYTSSKKKYVLGLYDAASRQTNNDAVYASDTPFKVAFLPDGKTVVTADAKGKVILWKFAKQEASYDVGKSAINDLAVSRDGKTLALACDDKTVKLVDVEKGEVKQTLAGHTEPVLCVAFSPDGKYLASGGKDNKVRLWDAANGKELATGSGHLNSVSCVAFSPNGKLLVTGGADKEIHLWNLAEALKAK